MVILELKSALNTIWEEYLFPLMQRPKALQVAALCHRGNGEAREYLLVTSRHSGRWILPKGWPITGLKFNEAALREAWEEAGVRHGKAKKKPVGAYTYQKKKATGLEIPVETLVYSVAVKDLSEDYPEASERNRKWVKADDAVEMVNEAQLKSIFLHQ